MVSPSPTVTRRLRLRTEVFDRIMEDYGITTDTAKAEFLGIHQSQYTRAKNGVIQPSFIFIIRVLSALPRVSFERLFEIVEVEQ